MCDHLCVHYASLNDFLYLEYILKIYCTRNHEGLRSGHPVSYIKLRNSYTEHDISVELFPHCWQSYISRSPPTKSQFYSTQYLAWFYWIIVLSRFASSIIVISNKATKSSCIEIVVLPYILLQSEQNYVIVTDPPALMTVITLAYPLWI